MGIDTFIYCAFEWYAKAATLGHVESMYMLGLHYEEGLGTIPKPHDAFVWYLSAAKAGYIPARQAVARCYEKGIGVPCDPAIAATWK